MSMKIAVCAMVKDEPDLIEWLQHHDRIGIDHFFIYDNGSREATMTVTPNVTVETFCGKSVQLQAFNKCLREHGPHFDWIAFIDADEFIYPVHEPLKIILHDYRDCGGLVMHWSLFGSNGHLKRQPSVIDAYTQRVPFEDSTCRMVKSFVQPARVRRFESSHWCKYKHPYHAVNTDGKPVMAGKADPAMDRLRLNHYFLRSREDMEQKCVRGWGFPDRKRTMAELEKFDVRCTVEDTGLKDAR